MLSVSVQGDECFCSEMTKFLQIRGVVEEQASLIFVEWVRLPMSRATHKHSALASRRTSEYMECRGEASLLFIDWCRTTTFDPAIRQSLR